MSFHSLISSRRVPKQLISLDRSRGIADAHEMTFDIGALSIAQLDALISAAEHRLKLLSNRRPIADVRRHAEALAAFHGYVIGELFEVEPDVRVRTRPVAKRRQAKVQPKYQDPKNRRNTWTGRGRAPRWLAEEIKRGQRAADFLIPGLARPTAKKGGTIGKKSVYRAR